MTIPTTSNYPESIDTSENLFEVHDALRVVLSEDYNPGDTSISVVGPEETMNRFSDTGIITLTEQCNDPEERAVSFYYGSKTTTTFDDLEILPNFPDVVKPKRLTNVTQNVMSIHHNVIKDAVIAIEEFAGKQGEVGTSPLEGTMEQRINFLRNLVLVPKAWFTSNKTIGVVPLTIEFKDLSFRLGTDGNTSTVTYIWDFGDNTNPSIVELITATDSVPTTADNVIVQDLNGGTIEKTYSRPGIFDVKLTVQNDFGEDIVIFPGMINAHVAAPDEAVIDFEARAGQIFTAGSPEGGPYTTFPKIRAPINSLINLEILDGVNPNTGKSYGGELLDDSNSPVDPINAYTWSLADDLIHNNSKTTKATYSVGGVYDITLRCDTAYGAYRITTYEDVIDIVEKSNLWLWTFTNNDVYSYEFGLISETFKAKAVTALTIDADDSFLTGEVNEDQQKQEFNRNNGFAARGTTTSGNGGVGLLYWASGRSSAGLPSAETIEVREYNGFTDTYLTKPSISRPWNWVSFASTTDLYFILGGIQDIDTIVPDSSPTNQERQTLSLVDLSLTLTTFETSNYKNGAGELQENLVSFDDDGNPLQGHMSVYRSAWSGDVGYFLRNDGVGDFFRIKSFYKTSGTSAEVFQDIKKVSDMAGPAKTEGQLLSFTDGLFFFNNSGSVSAYNTSSSAWEVGGPGVHSASFRQLQDDSVSGFDENTNTLLAASDGDRRGYLSFDYSEDVFIKFNQTDLTFSSLGSRPAGEQWLMTVY